MKFVSLCKKSIVFNVFDLLKTKKWPFNPVNGVIQWLRTMADKKDLVVADMGCGEAKIAETLSSSMTIHSFDLVALNERVTACNMAKVGYT